MVDPDNRRPIDFGARAATLERIAATAGQTPGTSVRELWEDWRSGEFKLALTKLLLDLRAAQADLFAGGSYRALDTAPVATGLVGFERLLDRTGLVVVARIGGPEDQDAPLRLSRELEGRQGRNVLTGAILQPGGLGLNALLGGLPACVVVFE